MDEKQQIVVKARLSLGSESHSVEGCKGGMVSEQVVYVKGECMSIFKEFITKHNVPNDVPDPDEIVSSEDDETPSHVVKSKKIRRESN
ncbi:hypothetical protein Lser_V15G27438 [Lactuca serriola]|uniref:Uncharacterized protein n=1 Tax=Lactuca sativa TaxID=4236 RepID=A0A9R1VIX6_LACSA|nr:hypothetical protein LSAT_V11C500298500 [Lactuca sativa]